jgi:hypothetical protein
MDIALGSSTSAFDVIRKCCKWYTHVDCGASCEIKQEIVALK